EAQAQAQARLAAAAAAVAAAAVGQVEGGGGAGMGLLAGIRLADTTGNGHAADTSRCTGLPLALPLSLAVPSADGVPRLLLPAPAAAVAGTAVPGGGPPGNSSTGVEGGSGAAAGSVGDVQQSHEPAHHGYTLNLDASMENMTTRGSVPADLVPQLELGMHVGRLGVPHVSGSAGLQPEGALTHVAHVLPPVMSHGSVLLGLAMDPLAGPQSQPHAQALELPHQPQL
ncbi:hypothetical protein Vretimale_18880, partial [Volvox reticuliferus]